MATYLDIDGFKGLTLIPSGFVDDVEKVTPGWLDNQLEYWARWIDTRLRKRYASPFAAHDAAPDSTPTSIQGWLARIVTVRVMLKRGVDPNDEQYITIASDAEAAMSEVLEAANSDEGWFDIPLRTDEDGSAITRGNPRSYSEQSPYVWTDEQENVGRNEDNSGRGSSG
jgi:hypothetical protein